MPSNDQAPLAPAAIVPVAIYTRVSTENQVGGRFDSCESQLAICRDFITRQAGSGWVEVAHFSDPAVSGSSMNRPALRALMRQIEQGTIKVILIFKLERMSRNVDEFGPFRSFLKKHGCRLESATEDISENTPSGRLKNNLMLSFSQYERENTAEKTSVKMLEQAKRGYWNGGALPYGYAYDKNTQTLYPDPQELPVVQRIFEQAAKLTSLEAIADALNREGLRTRARLVLRSDGSERAIGQKRFRSDGLRMLVTNPIYRGVIRYAGKQYPGRHPAIVTPDLWEEANAAVTKYTRPIAVQRLDQDKNFNLLKGLVHCGCCHRALTPHASGNRQKDGTFYRYYYCSNLIKERVDARCSVRRIAARSLETAVTKFLGELGRHGEVIGAAVNSSQTRHHTRLEEIKTELKTLEHEISGVTGRIRNCVEAISKIGKHISEELVQEVGNLKDRKQELTVRRAALNQERAACEGEALNAERVRHAVQRFGEVLRGLTPVEQKTLVGLFVDRIDIRPAKEDAGAFSLASVRTLDLQMKLNIPRLVEGMEEKLLVQGASRPSLAPGMVITVKAALGQQGRASEATLLAPFRCEDEASHRMEQAAPAPANQSARHPIHQAQIWNRVLKKNSSLSLRGLAKQEGEVPPTLVRHFKLLKLLPEIQDFLTKLTDLRIIRHFSLREMMKVAAMEPATQRRAFMALQAELSQQDRKINPYPTVSVRLTANEGKGPRLSI